MVIGGGKKWKILNQRFNNHARCFRCECRGKGIDLLPEKEPMKRDMRVMKEDVHAFGWLESDLGNGLKYGKEEGLG